MKKITTVIIIAVLATAGYFGYDYAMDKSITNNSAWSETGNSEFTVKLPESMKSSSNLFYTSDGQEQIAFYENSKVDFSVVKIPYSVNENLKNIDVKSYLENLKINGNSIDAKAVNGGYYYAISRELKGYFQDTKKVFEIDGMFKGENAFYNVEIHCRERDRNDYENYMIEWLESFKLK